MPRRLVPDRRSLATLAYVALAATDSVLAGRASSGSSSGLSSRAAPLRRLTKPLLMPMLIASGRSGVRHRPLQRAATLAQACSWGGDVALLGSGRGPFLAGVGSFFGAHVAYLAGFATVRDRTASLSDPGPRAAALAWTALAPMVARAAHRQDPALGGPVAAYGAVLAAMFGASTMLDPALPASARRRVLAGTSLFLLSDAMLGARTFLRETPSPPLDVAVMATYTTGQLLIARGVSGAAS